MLTLHQVFIQQDFILTTSSVYVSVASGAFQIINLQTGSKKVYNFLTKLHLISPLRSACHKRGSPWRGDSFGWTWNATTFRSLSSSGRPACSSRRPSLRVLVAIKSLSDENACRGIYVAHSRCYGRRHIIEVSRGKGSHSFQLRSGKLFRDEAVI